MPDMGIEDIRELFRLRPRPPDFPERRKRLDAMGAIPLAPDIKLETETVGSLRVEWSLAEGADPSKALLYLHGGGYCSGSIASHRYMVAEAGRAAGVRTLAVNYRVAPEHPFPAALEDARAAYDFLIRRGFTPDRIAVGGDSAGGGLTLALLTLLRDAGSPMPACGWLVSPWVDLQMTGGTIASKADVDPMIQKDYLDELTAAYVGGADAANPLISPLHADLRGLPPLLVQVGSDETLLDDAVRIAGRAGAAEVAVTLEIWPRMIHVWHLWASVLADARLALASAGAFVRAKV
ncbi:alpha/beta hydrolase [Methylocapsa palsarum]|uniref:Acetyl esterase/lipase n=1 Tax=Methylocapsa palsarum TaxID=1612308 RepID=A0A1I3WWS4_9HYPH|nr:alpha/beta hydrolase [Methylocapsa palsarum]SFK11924.1 Acetyl esterase/lipase [Methylocapsa palsarum]